MTPNRAGFVKAGAVAPADGSRYFRRLKWNELVRRGDFVADGLSGFEPWEGPGGFRADAFVKTIYRKRAHSPAGTREFPRTHSSPFA